MSGPGVVHVLGFALDRRRSDPDVERAALARGAALVEAPWERRILVDGPDARAFLHVLLTQDIRGLAVGASAPAALATRKGHLVADLTVLAEREDAFSLRVSAPAAGDLLAVLESHRVLEEVRFRATPGSADDPTGFLLAGPEASAVCRRLVAAGDVVPGASAAGTSFMAVREVTREDIALFLPSRLGPSVEAAALRAGAVPVGWDAFDRSRIEAGRAWFGIDADGERLVPEPGFGDRIHYDKGCYLGQEPLARLHFRGRPNWALVQLVTGLGTDLLVPGADLLDAAGERVGWVTSVAQRERDCVALGYLHRRARESGAVVTTGTGHPIRWNAVKTRDGEAQA